MNTSTEHSANSTEPNPSKRLKRMRGNRTAEGIKTSEAGYDPEFAILICERIASSPRSLVSICSDPDMPSRATLFRWLRDHPEFQVIYREAKEAQADILIEQGLDIIDDDSKDLITTADGRTIINTAAVQRSKARVEYRKWIASKLLPRKYGSHHRENTLSSPASSNPDPDREKSVALPEWLRMELIEERRRMMEDNDSNDEEDAKEAAIEPAKSGTLEQPAAQTPTSEIRPSSPEPYKEHDYRDFIYPVRML